MKYLDAWSYTEWFNLLGTPAAVVPVGKSPEGLPIGVQIVARPWEEELVISVAAALEEQVGRLRPPSRSVSLTWRAGVRAVSFGAGSCRSQLRPACEVGLF